MDLENQLNAPTKEERLSALKALASEPAGERQPCNVNNHIHTTYSFSPYSPAMAAYKARQCGLITAGIMDHDTIAGAPEFLEATRILGIAATCGIECRVDFKGTPFAGRRLNNPDQAGVAYMSLHGVPSRAFGEVQAFFAPYRMARDRRNRAMSENIAALLKPFGLTFGYERDVLPLSLWREGGAVTERHLMMALSNRLIGRFGRGAALLGFVEGKLGLAVPGKERELLSDEGNPHYAYDLLGLFKGYLMPRFYVDATDECPKPGLVLDLARRTGSISAYPYLGDVERSVTGDKRSQTFEDPYLDDLMQYLSDAGFMAVTYAPTRNTRAQLSRMRALCVEHGFFQVSGEDINSPRQGFLCEALNDPEYQNLVESTWALIAHERLSGRDISLGMFSEAAIRDFPLMQERVDVFAAMGREMYA
jgi:hypothetical protein